MKILVVGATGMVGSQIVKELSERGHETTLASRSGGEGVLKLDASDVQQLTAAAIGHDVVVFAVSPPRDGSDTIEPTMKLGHAMIAASHQANVQRLMVVGGAGSLLLPDGSRLCDAATFPPEYKAEAIAHLMLLEKLRTEATEINWTYISPAAAFSPGERTGKFVVGGDSFMTNAAGESYISVEDFAIMLVNELEHQSVSKQRLSVVGV
ncbi:NAD-dependent epimerase/dehydratase family protein [Mangrovimicrobium sediminis]|uniref:NAD-dependent epimerase/dehydratase family protein n=2 Tax=Mangrovimicrobium sediminis TaxID=2562682 RepID=A0A4Z0LWG7_9GAMM|nr:NAD-dependent epimerase/dehydratase family protein [Haliea sp. SAOS-164]